MFETLFHPRSVAVIGASQDTRKVGHSVLNNLVRYGFRGELLPVNPKAGEILGLKTYPGVDRITEEVDLAVITVPAKSVPDILRQCARKGVRSAAIISAGFKEAGPEGMILEEELKEIIVESGMRVLGPNCLGVINTANNLNATFAAGMLPAGRLSFFSQSGALGIAVLDWAIGNRVGFSKFISLGNKTDLNETDFIEYFMDDEETDIILGYIEDVVDGKRFLDVARKTTKIKPIILVKSGGTQAGARAASSHTGALAGSETAFDAAFRQTGVIRAKGIEELFETARAFNSKKLPAGDNLLIVTNAGGPGIIAADAAERLGINLPSLSKETIAALSDLLPKNASLYNPVDIIGDAGAERFEAVFRTALNDPNVDGFLVILTPQATINVEETARVVIETSARTDRPFITSFMGEERVRTSIDMLKAASIPNFSYPEPAVAAFRRLCDYSFWRRKDEEQPPAFVPDAKSAQVIVGKAMDEGRQRLAEDEAQDLLSLYGFRFPKKSLVRTPAEAASVSSAMGFPVVMKISSPDILHKTDIGGVRLGVRSMKEAKEAFSEITINAARFMPSAFINGVVVCETVPQGKEVILGISFDRTFGHMIMFGLGGIYVEVLKDVAFGIIPVSEAEARQMISGIRSYPLLKGARGERPADIEAIVGAVLRLSRLAVDFPVIQELDINPLVVSERGAIALDARVIFGK